MAQHQDKVAIGWKLDGADRASLLTRFPPIFPVTVADHVTLHARAPPDTRLPDEAEGEIVGQVDDDEGLQALVVSIGGTTGRPDGGTYHITWSLGRERRPEESNAVLARLGWRPLPQPIPIRLIPASFLK